MRININSSPMYIVASMDEVGRYIYLYMHFVKVIWSSEHLRCILQRLAVILKELNSVCLKTSFCNHISCRFSIMMDRFMTVEGGASSQ